MSLKLQDVTPGIVARMDIKKLKSKIGDSKIQEIQTIGDTEALPDDSRPFLCIGVLNGRSQWAELTTKYKPARMEIKKEWRKWQRPIHGFDKRLQSRWRTDKQYLHGVVLEGDNADFVDSSNDTAFDGDSRCVPQAGVKAARAHLSKNLKGGHKLFE